MRWAGTSDVIYAAATGSDTKYLLIKNSYFLIQPLYLASHFTVKAYNPVNDCHG
jgi:hypothetical protein